MTTHAIILAAGTGTRLRPLTEGRPKALVPLADRPIIGHALDALAAAGVAHVVVVGGHEVGALSAYLAARRAPRVCLVTNPAFATTNTLASLACAAPAVEEGDFLLIDGDLVFEPAVLARLAPPGTRLAVDHGRPLDDDAVKVATDGDRILAVGKTLPGGRPGQAESIGLARIDAPVAPALFAACRALLAAGATGAYYEAAFERLIDDGVILRTADVTSLKWEEIDDHDDLRRAHSLFVAA